MDLAEVMKTIMAKEAGIGVGTGATPSVGPSGVGSTGLNSAALAAGAGLSGVAAGPHPGSGTPGTPGSQSNATAFGPGFLTEKMYMLVQLYIQNKGWNSVELLQCFTELKESAMIPNPAAYFQLATTRLVLDTQGRLVHRENGKIILPFEHFPNAVMIKHMNGPHGLHLNVEGTIRGLAETYTVGREYFGVDKDYVTEIIQNCPHPPCRFFKNQLPTYHSLPESSDSTSKSSKGHKDLLTGSQRQHQDYKSSSRGQLSQSLADASSLLRASAGTPASFSKSSSGSEFPQVNLSLPSLLGQSSSGGSTGGVTSSSNTQNGSTSSHHHNQHHSQHHQLMNQHHHQSLDRESTAQLLKNNISLELSNQAVGDLKTVNAMLELSRAKAAVAAAAAANVPSRTSTPAPTRAQILSAAVAVQQHQLLAEKVARNIQQEKLQQQHQQQQQIQQQQLQQLQQHQQHQQQQQIQQQQLQQQQIQQQQIQMQIQQLQQQQQIQQQQQQQKLLQQKLLDQQQLCLPSVADHKLADFLRANLDTLDSISGSNKDLLALHNGAWSSHDDMNSYKRSSNMEVGQEKIVRAFQEIMKNMHRMKMCVRPSMCKPYGKQSEMLQKTLEETLLLVQALRSLLPPPQY